jgi:hypothetical protein
LALFFITFFADIFYFFTCLKRICNWFLKHFYDGHLNPCKEFQHMIHLSIGISWLSFCIQILVFFILGMEDNFLSLDILVIVLGDAWFFFKYLWALVLTFSFESPSNAAPIYFVSLRMTGFVLRSCRCHLSFFSHLLLLSGRGDRAEASALGLLMLVGRGQQDAGFDCFCHCGQIKLLPVLWLWRVFWVALGFATATITNILNSPLACTMQQGLKFP